MKRLFYHMKSALLSIVSLFLLTYSFCQVQEYKVINKESGIGIPYATIRNLTKKEGIIATDSGIFRLAINPTDSVLISSVGFVPLKIIGSQIATIIELKPKFILLKPVTVANKKSYPVAVLGNENLNKKPTAYWGPGLNAGFAQLINMPDSANSILIKKLIIPVRSLNCYGPFLVHIYLPDSSNGLPGEEILIKKVNLEKKMVKRGKAFIDISDDEITIGNVPYFYFGFSWLSDASVNNPCLTELGVIMKDSNAQTESVIRALSLDFAYWEAGKNSEGHKELWNTLLSVEAVIYK